MSPFTPFGTAAWFLSGIGWAFIAFASDSVQAMCVAVACLILAALWAEFQK